MAQSLKKIEIEKAEELPPQMHESHSLEVDYNDLLSEEVEEGGSIIKIGGMNTNANDLSSKSSHSPYSHFGESP